MCFLVRHQDDAMPDIVGNRDHFVILMTTALAAQRNAHVQTIEHCASLVAQRELEVGRHVRAMNEATWHCGRARHSR